MRRKLRNSAFLIFTFFAFIIPGGKKWELETEQDAPEMRQYMHIQLKTLKKKREKRTFLLSVRQKLFLIKQKFLLIFFFSSRKVRIF